MPKAPLDEISKTLASIDRAKKQARDSSGKFTSGSTTKTTSNISDLPPMVSVTVTNPVAYFKYWWKKVMSGEGIDVKLRIHPVTAIVLALIICGAGFGMGRLTFPADNPIVKYVPGLGPTPTESPYKLAIYTGVVQKIPSTGKYYLLTAGEHVIITLSFPDNVDFEKLVGKRILAEGKFNIKEQVLYVTDASDMEYLPPTVSPVPTVKITPILVEDSPTPTVSGENAPYNFEEPTL